MPLLLLPLPLVDLPLLHQVEGDLQHEADRDGTAACGGPSYLVGIDWGAPGGDAQALQVFQCIPEPGPDVAASLDILPVPRRRTPDRDPEDYPSPRFALIYTRYDPPRGDLLQDRE